MVEKDYKHLVGGIKRVSLTLSPSAAKQENHFGMSNWYIE